MTLINENIKYDNMDIVKVYSDLEVPITSMNMVTLSKKQLEKISSRLPIFHKKSYLIGHSTSQSSYSLQTLNMINDSPISRIKQILAQINKRHSALRDTYFKIENIKLDIKDEKGDTDRSKLFISDKKSLILQENVSMENALREIGMFQDMYEDILKNHGIKDDWDENDFEDQEISNMIIACFRIIIQDLTSTGRVSRAAVEYCEQLGIHPQLAESRTRTYMVKTQEIINNTEKITIQLMYDFQDEMVKEFKDSYKSALKRIGIDNLGSAEFRASEVTKPQ